MNSFHFPLSQLAHAHIEATAMSKMTAIIALLPAYVRTSDNN
ncbi:hypothetical protein LPL9_0549 [Lacticaseibacillus paracasei]|nr:hypothetical protein LPL9_0549 [Lacticaseibacillus paracasei]EPC28965.1 hypothetical protein Lpp46_0209 [Lacticaseibacillus paracasei subsp. paracasei Lpp46]QHV92946.1 hypothetical protein EOK76_g2566 [Lacticaseibacillus paracasei]